MTQQGAAAWQHYRCGRLPHVEARVAAAPRLAARTRGLIAPTRLDRSHLDYRPRIYSNARNPTCTAVSIANAATGTGPLNGSGDYPVDPASVDQFYADTVGVPVADIGQTEGALLLDAVEHQCRIGMPNGQDLLCGPFAALDPDDFNTLRVALTFGGLPILGVRLSESDAHMPVWDTDAPAGAGDPTPGSGGLHALNIWDYLGLADTDTVRLATWGAFQLATWRWLKQRLDEAYVVVWRDRMPASGLTWAGLNYQGTVNNLRAWGV